MAVDPAAVAGPDSDHSADRYSSCYLDPGPDSGPDSGPGSDPGSDPDSDRYSDSDSDSAAVATGFPASSWHRYNSPLHQDLQGYATMTASMHPQLPANPSSQ